MPYPDGIRRAPASERPSSTSEVDGRESRIAASRLRGHGPGTARCGRTRPNTSGVYRRPHGRCGFAGAAITLVETPAVEAFVETMTERFEAPGDQPSTKPPAFHNVWPLAGGARGTTLGMSITLSEAESRRVVSGYGVPVSPFVTGTSTAEVLAAVEADASVTSLSVIAPTPASPTPTPSRQRATNSSARPFPRTARSRSSSPRWSTATAS